ncbi:MAG: ABC transporter permease subunit [Halobacteria archaeon]|nr:ABC transporter permease subunit [Halobacteria archaeon]
MFEITKFETRRRLRGALMFTAFMGFYIALVVAIFPSLEEAGLSEIYGSLPEDLTTSFIGDFSITDIEGYLVVELYQVGWLLLLGVYFAYSAASSVAGEVEKGSVDLLLSHPVSRSRVVVGKFVSVVPSIATVSFLTYIGVYLGVRAIDETVDAADLFVLHSVSVFYLSACASLGLLFSVVFDEARKAQMAAIGGVFGMFLVETLTVNTDYDWIGDLTFARYFDPGEILIAGEISTSDIGVLVASTVALVVVSAEIFERKDVT